MSSFAPIRETRKLPVAALILEDDPLWARIIADALGRLVDEVHHADTLSEGVRLWHETKPAAIFVDVGLGSDNGLDFVELVRSEDSTIPLLLITGDDTQEVAVRAINLGVTRFVPKPVLADQLIEIVDEVLARHRRELDHTIQEHYFQALLEFNADMILVLNGDGEIRYATPSVHTRFGSSRVYGVCAREFVTVEDRPAWEETWAESLSSPGRVVDATLRICTTDGWERWLGLRLRNLLTNPDVAGVIVNARDLTDERTTQERLKAVEARLEGELATSKSRYRTLFDLLPVGVTVTDDGGRIIDHNAAARELLELDGEEDATIVSRPITHPPAPRFDSHGSPVVPEELPAVRALRTGETVRNEVVGYRASAGRRRWLSVSAAPYELPHGKMGAIAVYPEVSDQIARQEEQSILLQRFNTTSAQLQLVNGWLREIAQYNDPLERIPALLNQLQDVSMIRDIAVYRYDAESRLIECIGGRGGKQWPSPLSMDRFPEDALSHRQLLVPLSRLDEELRHAITAVSTHQDLSRILVVPIRSPAGLDGLFVCESGDGYGRAVRDLAGALAGTLGLMMQKHRDAREREHTYELQRYNEQFRMRLERLVAMGSLASAIGHEINQPLQSIKILADSTLYWRESGQDPDPEAMAENIRRISERATWAARIVRSMKVVFSNPSEVESSRVDVAQVTQRALETVEDARAAVNADIHVEVYPQASHVQFSEIHLKQVLVNLLKNSFRVMGVSGVADPTVAIRTRFIDGHTCLEVEDNGPGVPLEVQDRIFDPFYSTADRTENMGLGLYVVHTLLRAFNFSIRVENGQWGGARFVIEAANG
ncbi:MAG TPA: ATP-binding protein [Alkalispirochaeta sp.]|nr:ATP-binding protein [Alkalispirochaeta sp.]